MKRSDLTAETDFAVQVMSGHVDQGAKSFRPGLFPGQVTNGLFIFAAGRRATAAGSAAEHAATAGRQREAFARLKVHRAARSHQVVGRCTVPQTQILTLGQHLHRGWWISHLNFFFKFRLCKWVPSVKRFRSNSPHRRRSLEVADLAIFRILSCRLQSYTMFELLSGPGNNKRAWRQ